MSQRQLSKYKANFCAALLAWPLLIAPAAAGYRVTPVTLDLRPQSGRSSDVVRVENTGTGSIALEIRVSKRVVDANGLETNEPADNDLIVLPPQGVLAERGSQAFRVQYAGPAPASGVGYLVTIAQLPVDLPKQEKSGIRLLVNFSLSTFVNPPNATADLKVLSVKPGKGKNVLALDLENKGNRAFSLGRGEWQLTTKRGKQHTLNAITPAGQQSNLMPSNFRRAFEITLPPEIAASDVAAASFTLREK